MLSKLKRADFSEVVFVKEFGGSPDGFFKLLRNHHRSVQGLTFHIRYVEGTNKVIGIAYQGRGSVGRVTFPTGKAMENQMRLMAEFQSKMTTKEKL